MSGKRRLFFAALALGCCLYSPSQLNAQGYGGPSLLSRGGNRPGHRGRAPIDFNVYLSVRGLYESGLIVAQLNEQGDIQPVDTYGVQGEVGLYGGKDWKRNSIGLDYRGDYRHQPSRRGLSGSNHALSLASQHRIARRLLLVLQQTGGTTNRAFGGFAAPYIGDNSSLGVPLNELFDSRIYYMQSGANLAWQRSARTTVSIGGDVFFVKRKSLSLINGQGARAIAGWSYRVNRATTVLVNAGFMRFEFPRVFSNSDIYSAGLGVETRLRRNVELRVVGGLFQIESKGVENVQLSPEVAAILGRTRGAVAFGRSDRAPLVEATLSHLQERGRAFVGFFSGVNPGNGVFLTTSRKTVNAGYSYTGLRRLSLGVSGGWTRTSSAVLTLDDFQQWQAGGGLTYQLAEHLSFMTQVDRRYFTSSTIQGRTGTSVSVGLAYTPSRFPLSIF